jgi:hypothetical protein
MNPDETFVEPIIDKQIGEFMEWGLVYDYRAHWLNYIVDMNQKALLPDLRMLFVGYIQGDSLDTSHMISTANNILEYFINYMAEIQQRMYPKIKREIHTFASFELLKNWCERTQKAYMMRVIDNNFKNK